MMDISASEWDIYRRRQPLTLSGLRKLFLRPAECPRLDRILRNEPEQASHAEDCEVRHKTVHAAYGLLTMSIVGHVVIAGRNKLLQASPR